MMHWLIETMIAASLLMLAVLLLRPAVMRHFGPRAAYLLWLAPALRMVLPPLPDSWFSPATSGAQNVLVVLTGASSLPLPGTIATGGGAVWPMVLLGLWLGGAALFFVQHILTYWAFTRDIRADAEPLFSQGRINVARSHAVISPIAFGILGKTIIVPADFIHRFDETEQRLALSHEAVHHQRGDLAVNIAALALLALHWFNPIAHFAHRAFRLDQEAACDDLVLAGSSSAERQAYGTALYKSATGGLPLVACAMGTASQLKARLQWIIARPEQPAPLAGMGFMSMLVLAGLVSTASGSVAEPVVAAVVHKDLAANVATVSIATPTPQAAKPVVRKSAEKLAQPAKLATAMPIAEPARPIAPFAPVAPVAPQPPAQLTNVNCVDTGSRAVFIHRANMSIGVQQEFIIVVCDSPTAKAALATPAGMIGALESARAELTAEPALSDGQRANIIDALEVQIVQLKLLIGNNDSPSPSI